METWATTNLPSTRAAGVGIVSPPKKDGVAVPRLTVINTIYRTVALHPALSDGSSGCYVVYRV